MPSLRRFEIVRQVSADSASYLQRIDFPIEDSSLTVALALDAMNHTPGLADVEGTLVEEIRYEHSCLQRKCGACAMLVNGRPALACDTRLADLPEGPIRLAPLATFPVVADLVVDRSAMRRDLAEMRLWLEGPARLDARSTPVAYEASRCLACGCCLEVCPNFSAGNPFYGAAATAASSKLIAIAPREQGKDLSRTYLRHVYAGCGKSLACQDVCPVDLPLERLLSRSNAATLWRALRRG